MKSLTIIAAAALAASAVAPMAAAQDGPQVGARVMASDGSTLGRLEGRRGQDLVVRGEDGTMRAIPAGAVTMHGDMLHATWTPAQFRAAETVMVPAAPGNTGSGGGNQGMRPEQNTANPAGGQPSPSGAVEDATRPGTAEQTQAPPPQA